MYLLKLFQITILQTRIIFPKHMNFRQISFLYCYDCKQHQDIHRNASIFCRLHTIEPISCKLRRGCRHNWARFRDSNHRGLFLRIQSITRTKAECDRLLLLIMAWEIYTKTQRISVKWHKWHIFNWMISWKIDIHHNPIESFKKGCRSSGRSVAPSYKFIWSLVATPLPNNLWPKDQNISRCGQHTKLWSLFYQEKLVQQSKTKHEDDN